MSLEIEIEDPRTDDVKVLLQRHLDFCHQVTPAEHSFALDLDKFNEPGISLFGARENGALLGIGALKDLGNRETIPHMNPPENCMQVWASIPASHSAITSQVHSIPSCLSISRTTARSCHRQRKLSTPS